MIVDHTAAKVALDAAGWKLERFPSVTVHLAEPGPDGQAELTIEGDHHAEPKDVAVALGLPVDAPVIKRYDPAARPAPVAVPAPDPTIVEANVPPPARTRSQKGRK